MVKDITSVEPEELSKLMNSKQQELMYFLEEFDYRDRSITEVADELGRNYSIVYRNIKTLEDIGVVEIVDKDGKSVPRLKTDHLMVEPFKISQLYQDVYLDNGIKVGESSDEGDDMFIDYFGDEPRHELIQGRIGTGKTFNQKLRVTSAKDYYDDLTILVVDCLKGFQDIGGNVITGLEDVVEGEINMLDLSSSSNVKDEYVRVFEGLSDCDVDGRLLVFADEFHYVLEDVPEKDNHWLIANLERLRENGVAISMSTQSLDDIQEITFELYDVVSYVTRLYMTDDREYKGRLSYKYEGRVSEDNTIEIDPITI